MSTSRRKKQLLVRVTGGALVLALVGAACSGGTEASEDERARTTTTQPGTDKTQTSTSESVDTGAAQLNQVLTAGLIEHEYLAGIAIAAGVQFGLDSDAFAAAAGALDKNSVDLANAIESVYGEDAGDAFLDSWRKHIGFFVDYTEAVATGDKRKARQAKQDLDGYRQDFGELIEGVTEGALPADAVADALTPHVQSTLTTIDAVVGARDGNPFVLLKKAASHLPGIADALSAAISQQFPEMFAGDATSPAADLQQTLTTLLMEHEYLAGIAVVQALTHEGGVESPEFQAAAEALDQNSVDLAKAIESVYGPEAGNAFLASWRKHIGFFVNYTLGKATGDRAMVKQAKKNLDGYRRDFGELMEGATDGILPADAVAEALKPHVRSTFKAIDATVAFTQGSPNGDPFVLLKKAASHMPGIATAISGAIVEQFPEKF